jgi:hypothetical protein
MSLQRQIRKGQDSTEGQVVAAFGVHLSRYT